MILNSDENISKAVYETLLDMGLVPVEISARHVHLSQEDADKIFGKSYEFEIVRELSQPGQYLYKERVNVVGKKGTLKNVAILGPCRSETQVELSITDARSIGVAPVIKLSGDTKNASDVTIEQNGVNIIGKSIVAKRHIHMRNIDAKRLNIKNGEIVSVKMLTDRPIVFEDVVARVDDSFNFYMHIDFDEANGSALTGIGYGFIIKS